MGKIRNLLGENQRMEFYKVGDKVHQINRIPEDGGKHRRVIHNADGTMEAEDFISAEEYAKFSKSGERVDANTVGKK